MLVIGRDGQIDADPLFVDPANSDYRLSPGDRYTMRFSPIPTIVVRRYELPDQPPA